MHKIRTLFLSWDIEKSSLISLRCAQSGPVPDWDASSRVRNLHLCRMSSMTTGARRRSGTILFWQLGQQTASHIQSMRRPPKSAEIGVLRPGRSHIQAVFAQMAEEEGDIGLLSVVVWAFLAQCDHFLNKIEFVKDLSLRTKTCNKFFSQFLAEIVQRWLRWFLDGIAVQNFGCVHRETEDYTRKSEILER